MANLEDILKEITRLHPEFSLKIGRKDGTFMAEMRIANQKPAAAMGDNLVVVLKQAHGGAMRNIADRLLAESRLSEAVFDNAVTELEEDSDHRCGCGGCRETEDDGEYYDEYSEDFDDNN